jgi:magnesium-transporting ATPase (P-type)
LADICKLLTTLVAPATPAAIELFAEERKLHPRLSAIGAIPIARQFLVLSIVSLLTTLLIGLLEEVNTENISKSFLQTSGWPLFYVELFLLSAASLGSCFGILQKLNFYIANSTYDPKYQGTYWTRWVMGVISGVLISQLLTSWLGHPSESGLAPVELPNLGQTTLALLGGYSAGLVHRLLGRIMSGIETMFGDHA